MADKIADKQNATASVTGNYAKRNFSSEGVQQPVFGVTNFPSELFQQPMFGTTNFSYEMSQQPMFGMASFEITQPNFNLQNQNIDRKTLEAINRMNAQAAQASKAKQDFDRAKLEKINSINSLAAQMTPEEKTKYSDDKTKFSWPYDSLPSADKVDNYSLKRLDRIFTRVSKDYNGTDGKQDGIIGDFEQGKAGDCWFLSETKLISKTPEGAEIIRNSIKNNNNGTFTVTFKGAPDKDYSVTEEEIRKSKDKLSEGDKDVRILEIAADKWRLETQGKSIGVAGTSDEAHFLLTGQKNMSTYFSEFKRVSKYTIANDKQINKPGRKVIAESVEPFETLQEIPEGQLFRLTFPETKDKDKIFKTKKGDIVYTKHAYFIERKGHEVLLRDSHDTAAPAVKMTLSECADREFILSGENLDFAPQRFFTRMLNEMHERSFLNE